MMGGDRIIMLREKLNSSCQHSKKLQSSRSISVQAGLIGGMFSGKRMGLDKVGGERHRQSRVRVVKVRAAKGQGGKCVPAPLF